MMYCHLCAEEILPRENHYIGLGLFDLRRWHPECIDPQDVENGDVYLVDMES